MFKSWKKIKKWKQIQSKKTEQSLIWYIKPITNHTYSSEEKIHIVKEGIRDEESIAVICLKYDIKEKEIIFIKNQIKIDKLKILISKNINIRCVTSQTTTFYNLWQTITNN